MPRRSNDFQKLVLFIEKQLSETNVKITESALLIDRDGNEREIDILLEAKIGGHEIKIALECRKHNRKGDVTWIDQIKGKYERLSSINKIVAISAKGFTSGAKTACVNNKNIELITLENAKKVDWESRIKNLKTAKLIYNKFHIQNVSIHINDLPQNAIRSYPNQTAFLFHKDKQIGTIIQHVADKLNEPIFKEQLDKIVANNQDKIINNELDFDCTLLLIDPPDFFEIIDPDNNKWKFNSVTASIRYTREIHRENVEILKYDNVQVATFKTTRNNYDHTIGVIQQKGKEFKVETVDWRKKGPNKA